MCLVGEVLALDGDFQNGLKPFEMGVQPPLKDWKSFPLSALK